MCSKILRCAILDLRPFVNKHSFEVTTVLSALYAFCHFPAKYEVKTAKRGFVSLSITVFGLGLKEINTASR